MRTFGAPLCFLFFGGFVLLLLLLLLLLFTSCCSWFVVVVVVRVLAFVVVVVVLVDCLLLIVCWSCWLYSSYCFSWWCCCCSPNPCFLFGLFGLCFFCFGFPQGAPKCHFPALPEVVFPLLSQNPFLQNPSFCYLFSLSLFFLFLSFFVFSPLALYIYIWQRPRQMGQFNSILAIFPQFYSIFC